MLAYVEAGTWPIPKTKHVVVGCIPSGYLTVCHGKSPFLIGKPSISIRAMA
jgi:hypothetical protein